MTSRILTTLAVAVFVFVQPVTADTGDVSAQNCSGIQKEQILATTGTPRVSRAHLHMKNDSSNMINAMQKNILLVQKRIEVAKKKHSLVCVECMERELPWMNKQLETATLWNDILRDPENTPLDSLEAYWAIQDTHKNVKNMKEKTDQYWRWKMDLQ